MQQIETFTPRAFLVIPDIYDGGKTIEMRREYELVVIANSPEQACEFACQALGDEAVKFTYAPGMAEEQDVYVVRELTHGIQSVTLGVVPWSKAQYTTWSAARPIRPITKGGRD